MDLRFGFSRSVMMAAGAILLVGSLGCDTKQIEDDMAASPGLLRLKTLSNRADLVSGGDVLMEVFLPRDGTADQLHVTVGTRDVSSAFAVRANGRILGRITGLAVGANKVTADLAGKSTASLTVTNSPIGGPIFTGAQVKPFVCATPAGTIDATTGAQTQVSGLSTMAIDEQCNIATEVKLYYRVTTPCLNVRPDPAPAGATPCFKEWTPAVPATDVAMTTTDAGVAMPYIVRVERGTLNRGIYDIAVLYDPAAGDAQRSWDPLAPQKSWNGKVVYSFGASSNQPRLQFRSEQNWNDDEALKRGFLVAINSMTDSLYNSNRTLMTETTMMMKEKIIDSFGEVKYVMGNGCSGGSINQLTAASIFPGLLDGIQPTCTYPDSESTGLEVIDCLQLIHAYSSTAWLDLMSTQGLTQVQIDAKKAAVNGHIDPQGCRAWVLSFAARGKPGQYTPFAVNAVTGVLETSAAPPQNNCLLPASMVYDKATNPNGIRCTGSDNAVSIFGLAATPAGEPKRARTTGDNVGVQYGLKALKNGDITTEEFVVLNEQAGGLDADANFTPDNSRTPGDPVALAIAYRAGIVSDGKQLAKTPIIDLRGWDDSGIHHQWRSFALRARLTAATAGTNKNYVMWRFGSGLIAPAATGLTLKSFLMMDKWLTSLKASTSGTIEARIAAARPTDAVDFCLLTGDATFTPVTDAVLCDGDARLKPRSSPRQVAGGPLAENILKCQLKKLDPADHAPAVLSDAQLARLAVVFPDGVCDWTKPGVGQQAAISPLNFAFGPGGLPFPPAPETKGGP